MANFILFAVVGAFSIITKGSSVRHYSLKKAIPFIMSAQTCLSE